MSTVPAFAPAFAPGADRRTGDGSAAEAFARARLTVVPRRRVRAARMPFVTLVSLVLLGGVVGLLCFNTQMQQASFAETRLQAQADTLTARQQTLHDQVQALRDPQHLAQAAQRAGMVIPETACTVQIGSGTTGGSCTPATNANTPPLGSRVPGKPAAIDPAPQVTVVQAAPAVDPADPAVATASTQKTGATGHHHRHRR